jgi:hypothetical protein
MNDILKALKMIDGVESKKTLKESLETECGDMTQSASVPVNQGNPVTASLTLNASGMDHVADLMRLLQQAGLEKPLPAPVPVEPMRTDMERLRDKMAGLEEPVSMPKPQYFDVDDVTAGGDDMHKKKHPADIRVKDASAYEDIDDIEEWANEPDEQYGDHTDMIKTLSGGINREKRMYKPAAKGDNPMAVESIKDRLYRALNEKKAKPDFLDVDKDGDTKEPMKKAIADKKKKGSIKEAELKDFKKKAVQGLYSFDHYEAPDGSFIQISPHGHGVYQDVNGNRRDFDSIADLKKIFSSTSESTVSEISGDLANRYTKAAKMDRDFNDDDLERLPRKVRYGTDQEAKQASDDMQKLQRRNSKRQQGINRAAKRM